MKSIKRICIATVLLLALGACGSDNGGTSTPEPESPASGGQEPAPEPEPTDEVLEVSYLSNWDGTPPQDLAFWIALERGYFDDENLDVTLEHGGGSATVASLVETGRFDFGNIASVFLIQNVAAHNTSLISVGISLPKDLNSWVFFDDNGIEEPADLEGRVLGTTAGSHMIALLPAFGDIAGFDADQVEVVAVDIGARITQLGAGQLDATTLGLGETFNITLQEEYGRTLDRFLLADYLPIVGYSVVAHHDLVADEPEKAERFMRAMQRAWSDLVNDMEASVALAADVIQREVESPPDRDLIIAAAVEAMPQLMEYESGVPVGGVSVETWQGMIDVLAEALEFESVPTVEGTMTNEFISQG